jgi:hypothetical protein
MSDILAIPPKFYQVKQHFPWGDYGLILVSGMAQNEGRDLIRAGPFVPPLTIPLGGDLIVATTELLHKLLPIVPALEAKPIAKSHIVSLPWETWDWDGCPDVINHAPEPEMILTERPHDPVAATTMSDLWRLSLPIGANLLRNQSAKGPAWKAPLIIERASWNREDVVFAKLYRSTQLVVTERGKDLLTEVAGEKWLEFKDLLCR